MMNDKITAMIFKRDEQGKYWTSDFEYMTDDTLIGHLDDNGNIIYTRLGDLTTFKPINTILSHSIDTQSEDNDD